MNKRFFKTEEEQKAYQLGLQDGEKIIQKLTVDHTDWLAEQKKKEAREVRSTVIWDMERYGAKTARLVKEGKKEYVKYYDEKGKEIECRWAGFPEDCASWMRKGEEYTIEKIMEEIK